MSKLDERKRRLAAVLFADVVGLNELAQRNHETGERLVKTYLEIQATRVAEHRGQAISRGLTSSEKTGLRTWLTGPQPRASEVSSRFGESAVEFHNCEDALDCAVAIQNSVREHNKGVATRNELFVRVGIHFGEVSIPGT